MRMIFVNLPVKDLDASKAFFAELGFTFNAEFTDDKCASLVIDENIFAMLIVEERFADFINGPIADPGSTEALIGISATSRLEVDHILGKALAAGAKPWRPIMIDGPMYAASFQDLDGHVWELIYMDM